MTFRGRVLQPLEGRFQYIEDGLLDIEDGTLAGIRAAPVGCTIPETHPGCIWLPGLVDTHLHFPQTRIIGSASGPLLPWLNRSVFPEESRFSERSYAEMVAEEFCDAMIRAGTVSACIYGSSHVAATDALFAALDRRGLKAIAGMTLMDRDAPDALLLDADRAREGSLELIERWNNHDGGRLRYCITPRFALSCSPALLEAAGDLASSHDLWLQTHVSENPDEIRAAMALFPGHRDYLSIYKDFGLLGRKSIYAHCIHLSEAEWMDIVEADAVVSHCPDSNFFLGSGCMPLADALSMGAKVAMGSDIGAGRSFSLRLSAGRAYDASLMRKAPVSSEKLLWLATVGGAEACGFGGGMEVGEDADLSVIRLPQFESLEETIDGILFRHDALGAEAVYVRGRRLRASS
jgi:guanine deaminase